MAILRSKEELYAYEKEKESIHNVCLFQKGYRKTQFGKITAKALDSEVAMRRVYGILLCAEEDENNRRFVCGQLLNTNKRFAGLVERPTKASIDAFINEAIDEMKNMPDSYEAKNAPMYFLAYLFYSAYGTDSDNQVVNDYLLHTYKQVLEMNKRKIYFRSKMHQALNLNGIAIPEKSQTLIKQLKTGFDLSSFIDFHIADSNLSNPELYGYINDYHNSGNEESWDLSSAIAIINMATYISNITGINLLGLNGPASITKDEQNMIIKLLADMRPGATTAELKRQINVTNYIIGYIFMLLAKEICNMKKFYFKTNTETQSLELQRLDNAVNDKDLEIEHLETELTKSNEQNELQRAEIRQLTDELFRENKSAVKPYVFEISGLNSKIRELEKALELEKAKNSELNALREFVFSLQIENVSVETTVRLTDIICGKKIIVLGGHIN